MKQANQVAYYTTIKQYCTMHYAGFPFLPWLSIGFSLILERTNFLLRLRYCFG